MSAVAGVRSMPMWRALAVRDFRLLWGSEAVSVIGDQFHFVALAWLVIDLTQSGLALGTVLIAAGVPRALMLLPFGVLADRRPPRTLMLVAHLARGVIVGAIAALVLAGSATLPLLAVLGALFGVADALYMPAQQAFLPRTLDGPRLPSANSILQGTFQLASIAGPPIAGAAIAVVGTGAAFAVDSVSFFAAALVVAMISSQGAVTAPARQDVVEAGAVTATGTGTTLDEAGPQPSFLAAIRDGIGYVLADPALRTTLLISLVLNFALSGPAAVGMPWLAEMRFDAGPAGLGLMSAAWAAGALAGTLVAGNTVVSRPGLVLLGTVAIAGGAMMVVGVASWLPAAIVALAVMGVCIGYTNIIAISWLQARVPQDMVGRVMSLAMLMGFGITPLSLGLAGAIIDLDATALFLASGAIVVLVAGAAAAARFPAAFDAPAPGAGRLAGEHGAAMADS
jgi:Major Facilitator Superfamily